ncbi:MAG: hypothetical protein AB7L09_00230 [Nitrospira sp.]
MDATARLAQSLRRVSDILEDVDAAIGGSGALTIVDEAGAYNVPLNLRRSIARTALYMLQEMSTESAAAHHEKLRSQHQAYKESLPEGHADKNISFNQWKKKDREKRGSTGTGSSRKGNPKKRAKGEMPPKKGAPKAPAPAKKRSAPVSAPSAAKKPAAKKTTSPQRLPKGTHVPEGMSPAELKQKLASKPKSRAKPPFEYEKGQAGLQQMGRRSAQGKVPSGGPQTSTAKGIRGNVEKLNDLIDNVNMHLRRGRGGKLGHEVPPGLRQNLDQHWYDREVEEPWRQQSPEAFRRHQRSKSSDLGDLEADRQARGLGRGTRGEPGHVPSKLKAKASKLFRMRMSHPAHRDREHDTAKGYSPEEHPKWKGHHIDKESGKPVHSSGRKENKKFANATTFRDSDDDAMLHTDKSKEGSRGDADKDEFVFHGNLEKDPRQKWFRVSKEGGYASAMGSLGKAYHSGGEVRQKVMDKVRSTGFVDGSGHQIDIRPTGGLHDARPECSTNKDGQLNPRGQALKDRDPKEFYRLCKGIHGPSDEGKRKQSSAERNEYKRGFEPQHDAREHLKRLHQAAESGKAKMPTKKIKAQNQARSARQANRAAAGHSTWAATRGR